MQWILKDPARFLREQVELEKLAAESWLSYAWHITREGAVHVDVDLIVHGRTYAGRLSYPNVFPNSPPYICPRDPSERWSGHQYGPGGSLCLEWRADNWHPDVTGAEMVRSACRLLTSEQDPVSPQGVPSAHRITLGQSLRQLNSRFVATSQLISRLAAMPADSAAKLETVCVMHKDLTVRFVSQVSTGEGLEAIVDLPSGLAEYYPLFAWQDIGWAFRSSSFRALDTLGSVEQLISAIQNAGLDANCLTQADAAGKLPTPVVLLFADDPSSMHVYSVTTGDPRSLRNNTVIETDTSASRLPEESSRLSLVRIGIVGGGSIGSKIAVSLARSGARRFLLVDDDILLPGNVVRHELDWASVGVHKVSALRDALRLIAPDMDITVRVHRIAGQESAVASAAALNDLSQCDLLIDATANPEVFLSLAAVAQSAKKPMVWMEVFARGYGGLIARARPNLDPNPLAVRDAILTYLGSLPPAPFQRATGYDDAEGSPLPAYDSDVGYIAAAATRLGLDTALQRDPTQFPYSVYLLGLRKEWIFEEPFDTRPVRVEGPGWEHVDKTVTPEIWEQAIKSALSMCEQDADANDRTTA